MSICQIDPELASRLPLDRIAECCHRYGVSELSVCCQIQEGDVGEEDEPLFLVIFLNDDFGPWGGKLDLLENDLSGSMHRKVHVSSRRGIQHSAGSPLRERILGSARLIYESRPQGAPT